jgi:hypothetical protein
MSLHTFFGIKEIVRIVVKKNLETKRKTKLLKDDAIIEIATFFYEKHEGLDMCKLRMVVEEKLKLGSEFRINNHSYKMEIL